MQVTIEKGRYHSVTIQGDFTGPFMHVELSAEQALSLLAALEKRKSELCDMAQNYYDCVDCGASHPKSIVCPSLEKE